VITGDDVGTSVVGASVVGVSVGLKVVVGERVGGIGAGARVLVRHQLHDLGHPSRTTFPNPSHFSQTLFFTLSVNRDNHLHSTLFEFVVTLLSA